MYYEIGYYPPPRAGDNEHALRHYASVGDVRMLQALFLNVSSLNFNEPDEAGRTALMLAASGGHLDCVKLLCDQRTVNLNAQDKKGLCALDHARAEGHDKVFDYLIKRRADKSLCTCQLNAAAQNLKENKHRSNDREYEPISTLRPYKFRNFFN